MGNAVWNLAMINIGVKIHLFNFKLFGSPFQKFRILTINIILKSIKGLKNTSFPEESCTYSTFGEVDKIMRIIFIPHVLIPDNFYSSMNKINIGMIPHII